MANSRGTCVPPSQSSRWVGEVHVWFTGERCCLAACRRVFWDEQGHAQSQSGETEEEVVQSWATRMQAVSHQFSWGLSFPCHKTRLMMNPRELNVQEALWPTTKHTAQAGEPRTGHTPVQKTGSFTGKQPQILDYRRRNSEKELAIRVEG